MPWKKTAQRDEIWHLRRPEPENGRIGINALDINVPVAKYTQCAEVRVEGEGVRVALCDVGVQYDHPALEGRIDLDNAKDFDSTLDPDGLSRAQGGCIRDPFDAHGTACAGLVCGIRAPRSDTELALDKQFIGVAPKCRLVPIRISTNFEIPSLIAAIKYAAKKGDVILLPRFLPEHPDLTTTLKHIAQLVPIVCAAGNSGTAALAYPAFMDEVIAVGACNAKGYRSTYSQYGGRNSFRNPDVVAPSNDIPVENRELVRLDKEEVLSRLRARHEYLNSGIQDEERTDEFLEKCYKHDWHLERFGTLAIATTDNLGAFGYNYDPPGNYCKIEGDFGFGGTSAAAAQVAGVIALMLAANPDIKNVEKTAEPWPITVKNILCSTTNKDCLKNEQGTFEEEFGHGLVDAAKAVAEVVSWSKKQFRISTDTNGGRKTTTN